MTSFCADFVCHKLEPEVFNGRPCLLTVGQTAEKLYSCAAANLPSSPNNEKLYHPIDFESSNCVLLRPLHRRLAPRCLFNQKQTPNALL